MTVDQLHGSCRSSLVFVLHASTQRDRTASPPARRWDPWTAVGGALCPADPCTSRRTCLWTRICTPTAGLAGPFRQLQHVRRPGVSRHFRAYIRVEQALGVDLSFEAIEEALRPRCRAGAAVGRFGPGCVGGYACPASTLLRCQPRRPGCRFFGFRHAHRSRRETGFPGRVRLLRWRRSAGACRLRSS